MNSKLFPTALRGIAVAMSAAVIVLITLGSLTTETAIALLSLGNDRIPEHAHTRAGFCISMATNAGHPV